MRRRAFLTSLAAGSFAAAQTAPADPWKSSELMEPAALAKRLESNPAPRVLCVAFPVLYRQRHIKGARLAGPGNKPEGLKELEMEASTLPKDQEIVLYCGCCPMKDCPNIRPAYQTMKRLGFTNVRVLNIPTNMHTDWSSKGYPVEPPLA